MALKAHISPLWRKQKLFIALFFWAVAAWFLFDGLYSWPRSNERWTAWKEHSATDWPAYAHRRGWVETPPHKFYTPSDIHAQYYCAGLAAVIGSLLFLYWITQKKRTLCIDDDAVYTPAGNRVPFNSIVGIGKKRWESKGLATVRYQEEGKQRQFVVDDYKFETEPTHRILAEIEERLLARVNGQN